MNSIDLSRGFRLTEAMKIKKTSVRELSKNTGYSTGFISNARNGADIKLSQAKKICEQLGITIQWFIYGDDAFTLEEQQLILSLRKQPEKFRKHLKIFIDGIAEE